MCCKKKFQEAFQTSSFTKGEFLYAYVYDRLRFH